MNYSAHNPISRQQFERIYPIGLSPKQNQVLLAFLQGKSNEEIAQILEVTSVATPSKHIQKIAENFGLAEQYKGDWRDRLIDLFVRYKPELVAPQLMERYGYNPLSFPDKPERADSYFYIKRAPIESDCLQRIVEPGSLLRIRAPKQMGKTSLINQIIAAGKQYKYQPAFLDLRLVETSKLVDETAFLRSFLAWIVDKLDSPPILGDWDPDLPVMVNCTKHFEAVLKQLDQPLLLIIDNVDRVLNYAATYNNFLPMLRRWYDLANDLEAWEQLRLVIAYRTEDYGRLDINQSPFNVGVRISVREFNFEEVEQLRQRHFQLNQEVTQTLINLVGGHPYLLRLAFFALAKEQLSLEKLAQTAASPTGIYKNHFRQLVASLQECPTLETVLAEIIRCKILKITARNTTEIYQLEAMGIVKTEGDLVSVSCPIYQTYFTNYFQN